MNMAQLYSTFNHYCDIITSATTINELGETISTGYTTKYTNVPMVYTNYLSSIFSNAQARGSAQSSDTIRLKFHIPYVVDGATLTIERKDRIKFENSEYEITNIMKLSDFYEILAQQI